MLQRADLRQRDGVDLGRRRRGVDAQRDRLPVGRQLDLLDDAQRHARHPHGRVVVIAHIELAASALVEHPEQPAAVGA